MQKKIIFLAVFCFFMPTLQTTEGGCKIDSFVYKNEPYILQIQENEIQITYVQGDNIITMKYKIEFESYKIKKTKSKKKTRDLQIPIGKYSKESQELIEMLKKYCKEKKLTHLKKKINKINKEIKQKNPNFLKQLLALFSLKSIINSISQEDNKLSSLIKNSKLK